MTGKDHAPKVASSFRPRFSKMKAIHRDLNPWHKLAKLGPALSGKLSFPREVHKGNSDSAKDQRKCLRTPYMGHVASEMER